MISVCIPVYNFDVRTLISKLTEQIKLASFEAELVIIDDCSEQKYKSINKELCAKHNYIELEANVGRSKIRNLFLKHTKFENLIFLDCDVIIVHDNFISNYHSYITHNEYSVVCGGRVYDKKTVKRNKRLRWKYGIKKESQPLSVRLKEPNKSFMTNNFLIKRELFESIRFEERIKQYGHEDTLFGYMLKQKGISIKHIDNPVLNGDIEPNEIYLRKTEEGLTNLVYIMKYQDYDTDFMEDVHILAFYQKLKHRKNDALIYFLYRIFGRTTRIMLQKGFVNLYLFNFYKLGYLIHCIKTIEI